MTMEIDKLDERRSADRLELPLKAYLVGFWQPACECEIVNLSSTGALVRVDQIMRGADLELSLNVAGAGLQTIKALIVDRSRDRGRVLALKFVEVPAAFRAALSEAMQQDSDDHREAA